MKITIQMPNFNHGHYLQETINSIRQQTYQNWEMYILDDGSTDNSWDILSYFANLDNRINIFRSDINRGVVATINSLDDFCAGRGKFMHPHAADNPLISNLFFEKAIDAFQKFPEIAIVFALTQGVDLNGNLVGTWGSPKADVYHLTPEQATQEFFLSDYIAGEAVIFKDDLYRKHGGLDPDLGPLCDLFINEALAALYGGVFIKEVVTKTSLDNNSYSRKQSIINMVNQAALMEKKFFNLPLKSSPSQDLIDIYRNRKIGDILLYSSQMGLVNSLTQLLELIKSWPSTRRPNYFEAIRTQLEGIQNVIEEDLKLTIKNSLKIYSDMRYS